MAAPFARPGPGSGHALARGEGSRAPEPPAASPPIRVTIVAASVHAPSDRRRYRSQSPKLAARAKPGPGRHARRPTSHLTTPGSRDPLTTATRRSPPTSCRPALTRTVSYDQSTPHSGPTRNARTLRVHARRPREACLWVKASRRSAPEMHAPAMMAVLTKRRNCGLTLSTRIIHSRS